MLITYQPHAPEKVPYSPWAYLPACKMGIIMSSQDNFCEISRIYAWYMVTVHYEWILYYIIIVYIML